MNIPEARIVKLTGPNFDSRSWHISLRYSRYTWCNRNLPHDRRQIFDGGDLSPNDHRLCRRCAKAWRQMYPSQPSKKSAIHDQQLPSLLTVADPAEAISIEEKTKQLLVAARRFRNEIDRILGK